MNLDNIQNIYIIGIEGAGTSALACILKAQGKNIIGSDEGNHFYYDVLKKKDIKVFHKFDKDNLAKAFAGSKAELIKCSDSGTLSQAFGEPKTSQNNIDLVIYSTSILPEQNEELKYVIEGKSNHFKVLSYSQVLGVIFNASKFGIAVCGTHGKTTTTAMLATAMKAVGADPTALVGAKVLGWGGGTLIGDSKYFIIEADEYQNKLQYYKPKAVILTSVDYDHPDFFKTVKEYKQVFKDFVARIPKDGFLVAYAGDKNVVEIAKSAKCEVIFYDIEKGRVKASKAGLIIEAVPLPERSEGEVRLLKSLQNLNLSLPGQHNLLNATATLKVIQKLKLNEQKAKIALENFQGTARRFEIKGVFPIPISETNFSDSATAPSKKTHKCGALISFFRQAVDKSGWFGQKLGVGKIPFKGKYNGAIIIDDYAHHPVEVQATLQAVKNKYPDKKIKCIFHPHTFTRTEALLDDFAKSFLDADEVYLLDIFGSAREKQGGVSSGDLVEEIKKNSKDKIVKNLHTISEATKYFQQNLQPNDVLITMGAGNVYLIGESLLSK